MLQERLLKFAKFYALQNALEYGKTRPDIVLSRLFHHGLKRENIKDVITDIKEIVAEINALSKEQQKQMLNELVKDEEIAETIKVVEQSKTKPKKLPPLPNAKQKAVVMRLAPFPSGPLHIGNARPYILNDEYVKMYKGKLLLVIDDTIGSEEKQITPEAYKLIPEGLKWLNIEWHETVYKSDRLEIYYNYAEQLIKKGKAYVCCCPAEILRENRAKGIECACRSKSIEQNLKEWHNMLNNKYAPGEAVLRLKTSMQHPNPAFRDRVLFRIVERSHPRTGNKYKVWPLLEFSWAIDDYLLGITHVLRGKELMIETEMEKYIFDIFGWKQPEFIHTGLLQIEGVKISKTKSRQEVLSGKYFGWHDPRTWSLQSLKLRGIKPEAIREFIISLGLTQTEAKVPIEILYQINKKYIDDCNRYFFIVNPVKIEIKNAPTLKARLPLHPELPKGERKMETSNEFYISYEDYKMLSSAEDGTVFRFMHLFNFVKKNDRFEFHSIEFNKLLNAKMLHWLPTSNKLVKAKVLMPNGEWLQGLAEPDTAKLKPDTIVQFERFGYCRLNAINEAYEFWFAHK